MAKARSRSRLLGADRALAESIAAAALICLDPDDGTLPAAVPYGLCRQAALLGQSTFVVARRSGR